MEAMGGLLTGHLFRFAVRFLDGLNRTGTAARGPQRGLIDIIDFKNPWPWGHPGSLRVSTHAGDLTWVLGGMGPYRLDAPACSGEDRCADGWGS